MALVNFTITGCEFSLDEGVIKVVESHNVTINGLDCTKNTNSLSAVCLTAIRASISLTHIRMEDNTGRKGGAVFLTDGSNVTIHFGEVNRNSALIGGAIQAIKSDLSLYNTTFEENYAEFEGGALYYEVRFTFT